MALTTDVACGNNHTLFLATDDTVYAFGRGTEGQLGNEEFTTQYLAVHVSDGAGGNLGTVSAIAAGRNHSVFLQSGGKVYCCGDNTYGQLGDGTNTNSSIPVDTGLADIDYIAAGDDFTLAVKDDGTVYAWGRNNFGQLGIGNFKDKNTPTLVDISDIDGVGAGAEHSLFIHTSNVAYACGRNSEHQLGVLNKKSKVVTPEEVQGITGIIAVDGGDMYSAALKSDGTLYVWGYSYLGRTGHSNRAIVDEPTAVTIYDSSILGGFTEISCGHHHMVGIDHLGNVFVWGSNKYGQLGMSNFIMKDMPIRLPDGSGDYVTGIGNVAAGEHHTAILKTDNSLDTCGRNQHGQLGIGSYDNKSVVTDVTI